MINFKPLLLAGLSALVISSHSVSAQQGPAPYGYVNGPYYGDPYGGNPNYAPNRGPYGAPYGYGVPYKNNNGFNRFFGGNNMPFSGNNRSFGERFWPGRGSYYDDVLPANGPWNRSWGRAPWNRDFDNLWGRNGGPSEWFNPGDPKEGIAQAWEDMLITPNGIGTMPGGWKAPSISVPNPIDVGDEFKDVARDMPTEMQNFSEGLTYGDEEDYNRGYNNGYRGQGNPNRGGITFDPSRRR